jgi:hypothetical protein
MALPNVDGFYSALLTGTSGQGLAMFVFSGGRIAGASVTGGAYDGSYHLQADGLAYECALTVRVEANATLIQGQTTGPQGLVYPINLSLPVGFADLPFIRFETPFGPVNVKLRKLRELEAAS